VPSVKEHDFRFSLSLETSPKSKNEGDTMIDQLRDFLRDEEGQDLVEYALLLVFIALAAIAVLPTLGSAVNNVFSQSASTLGGS
jgi:Flp pilus assembly pilin Flp